MLTPTTRKKVAALRAAKRVKAQILRRWKLNQEAMRNTIKCLQLKMKKIQSDTIQNHLQELNLSNTQVLCIA